MTVVVLRTFIVVKNHFYTKSISIKASQCLLLLLPAFEMVLFRQLLVQGNWVTLLSL